MDPYGGVDDDRWIFGGIASGMSSLAGGGPSSMRGGGDIFDSRPAGSLQGSSSGAAANASLIWGDIDGFSMEDFSSEVGTSSRSATTTRGGGGGGARGSAAVKPPVDEDSSDDDDDDNDDDEGGQHEGGGGGGGSRGGSARGRRSGRPSSAGRGGGAASGPARPALTQEEAREKRLERNRESARQSRRRKKQYLDLLESRVGTLHADLDRLRALHAGSAHESLKNEKIALLESVEELAALHDPTPSQLAILGGV